MMEHSVCARISGASPHARHLYRILFGLSRREGYCQPKQQWLAKEMGLSTKTVHRLTEALVALGLVTVTRVGLTRGNKYYLSDQERTPVSDQERTPVSDQERTPVPHPYTGVSKDLQKISSREEPAAAFSNSTKSEQVRKELTAMNLIEQCTPATVDELLRDVDLALAALGRLRELLADPDRAVPNPVGYLMDMVRNPAKYRFRRGEDGRWIVPSASGAGARLQLEDARRRKAREIHDRDWQRRHDAEAAAVAERAANVAAWEALSEAERQDIRATVRRSCPIFVQGRSDDSYAVVSLCFREMNARRI